MATTRKQMFLEKIHDSSFATPVPVTVEEEILDGLGGGVYVVNIVREGTSNNYTYNCDKTAEEIYAAVQAGKHVVGILKSQFETNTLFLSYSMGDECQFLTFIVEPNDTALYITSLILSDSDIDVTSWSVSLSSPT